MTGRAADDLEHLLAGVMQRVVEHGTRAEASTLHAMADAVRRVSPGAASALVDWDGAEIARLRAFGIVHGIVVRDLGPARTGPVLCNS